ncbi:hypothetical protein GCM10008995_29130 [Halobellus salinus]|uniref:Uncharacterized protein n=1 Tax=Halobellus salinus TaxID=931585 RepID=A0A830ETX8_9EURY|nr:hypothetical protein [Halobellus salinus]GGJ17551.1 hypothetical protein GCM10008995_29130 [Halobellus salinus]SMP35521.1 hypothetical protein SAMN06265347_1319 [Halobellus salinus]
MTRRSRREIERILADLREGINSAGPIDVTTEVVTVTREKVREGWEPEHTGRELGVPSPVVTVYVEEDANAQ